MAAPASTPTPTRPASTPRSGCVHRDNFGQKDPHPFIDCVDCVSPCIDCVSKASTPTVPDHQTTATPTTATNRHVQEDHAHADGGAATLYGNCMVDLTTKSWTSPSLSPWHPSSFRRVSDVMLEDFLDAARRAQLLSTAWHGLCVLARIRIQAIVSQSQDASDLLRACLFRPTGFMSPSAALLLATLRHTTYSHLCLETPRLQLRVAGWFITHAIRSGRIAQERGKAVLDRLGEPDFAHILERRHLNNRVLVDALLDDSGSEKVAQIVTDMAGLSTNAVREASTGQPNPETLHALTNNRLGPRWIHWPQPQSPVGSAGEGRPASPGLVPRDGQCGVVTSYMLNVGSEPQDLLFEHALGAMEL